VNAVAARNIGSPAMNFIPGPVLGEAASVTVGVRPEHFEIADTGVAVTVTLVEPMGSDTQITGKLGETEIIAMFHRRLDVDVGDVLTLRPNEIHRFDAASGVRL